MSRPVCVARAFGVAGSDVAQTAVPRRVRHRAHRFQKFLRAGIVGAVLSSTRSAPGWLHSSTGQELVLREVCPGLARGGRARSSCDSHLAWDTDSAVGQLLSLDMFPSWESALYFSTGSYSTVGSEDLLLPRTWRILRVVESGTSVLMGGLSVSFIFALITGLVEREARFSPELAWMTGQEASPAGVWERRSFEPSETDREGPPVT